MIPMPQPWSQTVRNSSATVSNTASGQIAAASSPGQQRTQIIITNTGSYTVTLSKGDIGATAGSGISLAPGGVYFESNDGGFRCWQGPIQAIATTSSSTIAIVEQLENVPARF